MVCCETVYPLISCKEHHLEEILRKGSLGDENPDKGYQEVGLEEEGKEDE